jgi:hypothetical protein
MMVRTAVSATSVAILSLTFTRPGGDEARDLVLPHGAERPDAARAEQLEDAELAEPAPPVAVGHEDQALRAPALRHDPHGGALRPRGERGVVRPQDLARRSRGRGHHHGHLAQLEVHERRVQPAREVGQRAVRERLAEEVVQAADHRKPPRAGRQPDLPLAVIVGAALPLELDYEQQEWEQESQEEEEVVRPRLLHDHDTN